MRAYSIIEETPPDANNSGFQPGYSDRTTIKIAANSLIPAFSAIRQNIVFVQGKSWNMVTWYWSRPVLVRMAYAMAMVYEYIEYHISDIHNQPIISAIFISTIPAIAIQSYQSYQLFSHNHNGHRSCIVNLVSNSVNNRKHAQKNL